MNWMLFLISVRDDWITHYVSWGAILLARDAELLFIITRHNLNVGSSNIHLSMQDALAESMTSIPQKCAVDKSFESNLQPTLLILDGHLKNLSGASWKEDPQMLCWAGCGASSTLIFPSHHQQHGQQMTRRTAADSSIASTLLRKISKFKDHKYMIEFSSCFSSTVKFAPNHFHVHNCRGELERCFGIPACIVLIGSQKHRCCSRTRTCYIYIAKVTPQHTGTWWRKQFSGKLSLAIL